MWREFLLWVDQGFNVLCFGYADETLSARAFRSRNRIIGRFMLPIIDVLFAWQTPDVLDDEGNAIESHCHRAYLKEMQKRGLPPEYRNQGT